MKMLNGESQTCFFNDISLNFSCDRYFNRDVECIKTFFRRRFRYESALYPKFQRTLANEEGGEDFRLDIVVAASGFSRKDMKVLEEVSVMSCYSITYSYLHLTLVYGRCQRGGI